MTIKAIKFFEDKIRQLKFAPEPNGCETTEEWKEQIEICKVAKSALEKQIPKKCTDGFHKEKFIDGRCPACSFRQSKGDIEWKRQFNKYCRNCGQKLLWESEN